MNESSESLIFIDDTSPYDGLKIAPAENNTPTPFFLDKRAEELSFPCIYGGLERKYKFTPTYTQIAKSEIRSYDRRACNSSHLLYAFKKSFNEKVRSALQVCTRQKSDGTRVTAQNIRTPGFLHSMIEKDDAYSVFKKIRSSPCYWKQQQVKVFAMMRQEGQPAFFTTVSPAETKWKELLVMLTKIIKGQDITEEEAGLFSFNEKADLITKDPVKCMLNFDNRFRALLNKLLKAEDGVFAPYQLSDYFTRVEFQMRGSPHSHGLYWIKNAPVYREGKKQVLYA